MFDLTGNIPFGWKDALDIAVVTAILYYVLHFVRGTRAVAALQGLVVLVVIYVCSRQAGLLTLSWLMESLFSSLFLVIVILFSDDIREGLSKIDIKGILRSLPFRSDKSREKDEKRARMIDILAQTACDLAAVNIGAIIVIEQKVGLKEFLSRGVMLDARLSRDLLYAIFYPKNPLHDGAAILTSRGRIVAAGCILPLTKISERKKFGTRHRAGLGITEGQRDCLAIIVSEERGEVTIAHDGHLSNPLTQERIRKILANELI